MKARERKPRAGAKSAQKQKPSTAAVILDWIKSMAIGLALFLVVRTLLIQTYTITSGSMENTFLIGDFVVVNKVAYGAMIPGSHKRLPGYDTPQRDDFVVFKSNHDDPPVDLIKRLVGVPGDTLQMINGALRRNGSPLAEPYVIHTMPADSSLHHPSMLWQQRYLNADAEGYHPTRDNWGPIVVPPGGYFMMGDNRDGSLDSRYWGFVETKDVIGRATVIYFSWDKQPDDPPFIHDVRWGRMFSRPH